MALISQYLQPAVQKADILVSGKRHYISEFYGKNTVI